MQDTFTDSVHRDAEVLKKRMCLVRPNIPPLVWDVMLGPYQEPWRHYHNTHHILTMIETAAETEIRFGSWDDDIALEWMILGHDWYYKVVGKRGHNEKVSAQETQTMLVELGMDSWICRVVPKGIRCTIDHQIPKNTRARDRLVIGTLLDLDLMGLGASPAEFANDTHNIWLEYMPMVTRDVFDAGRAAWARNFLKRDCIYHTPAFKHLESQARENLETLARSA